MTKEVDMSNHDWAALSLEYRHRFGLKQEAAAQDFNVDQSTISRWERGERQPSLSAKHMILNALIDAGFSHPDRSMQFLLEQSGSAVSVWDRNGRLRGYSARFEREMLETNTSGNLRGRSSRELLSGSDLVERAIALLERTGFFEGTVALAVFTFPPFLQKRRRQAGGVVTSSTFPVRLVGGEIAMLSILDHDPLQVSPEDQTLTVTWLCAQDGHTRSAQEPLGRRED